VGVESHLLCLCSVNIFGISLRNKVEREISKGESMVLGAKLGAKIDGFDTRC
jgi:hypothetical protein